MTRLSPRTFGAALAGVALAAAATVSTSGAAQAAYRDPTMDLPRHTSGIPGLGPHYPYVQEIMIGGVVPLKDEAIINRTPNGWLFRAGQQNSNLTVSTVPGAHHERLQFVDTGTKSWKWLPRHCHAIAVGQGVGATCRIDSRFTVAEPMLVEIWPRLGDDVIDTSALSARFDVSVLGDRGREVVRLGAGNNFVNGAQDADRVYGGPGRDWIRTGLDNDYIEGGGGDDYLVGVDGNDTVYGGQGNDQVFGSNGNDDLYAGDGRNVVSCGSGADTATFTSADRSSGCENRHLVGP